MTVENVTSGTFEQEVVQSDLPVLVDLWAPWCAPCKVIAPMLDKLADAYDGQIKIVKVDVQAEAAIAQSLGVTSVPTLLLFKAGEVVAKKIGAAGGQAAIEQFITPHL